MKNSIGLDSEKLKDLTEKLNDLLANYQLYYQNLRGFHWNLKGNDFFTLHVKFEELYNAAQESIDEIAERIVTLEAVPLHTYSDYVAKSDIEEHKNVTTSADSVNKVVENLSILINKEREALEVADSAGDESTVDMMTELIRFQEKTMWMLNSFNHK
jgi:starvation-inducible DNA-binding protein